MQFDIRRFDIYRKVPKDLTQPTFTGACISVCSILFIIYLFLSELLAFMDTELVSDMFVDEPDRHEERIPMKLDISLVRLNCKYPGLDIQDDLGRHEVGFVDNVERFPINNGNGCRFKARFQVNKVPGNFHISTHGAKDQPKQPDMTHVIHELTFGDVMISKPRSKVPGSFNPLRGKDRTNATALSSHDYFLKVVPTVIEDKSGKTVAHPYQYTYAYRSNIQYHHGGHLVNPAIWFRYDLNPITVKYSEKGKPLYSFLTTVCAIVGGTFTVAGIIDSMLFTATEIFKKAELGKLS